MLFIGICGASGSGKTTLSEELCKAMGEDISSYILNQDSYYFDHSDLSYEQRTLLNYDEPSIFDHEALYQDILCLLRGKAIYKKDYDFTQHARCDTNQLIYPCDVLILEGIHALYDARLCELDVLKAIHQC